MNHQPQNRGHTCSPSSKQDSLRRDLKIGRPLRAWQPVSLSPRRIRKFGHLASNPATTVWFKDIWTAHADQGGPFALPGDSGSLVVAEDSSSALGLLFAANPSGEYGWINPNVCGIGDARWAPAVEWAWDRLRCRRRTPQACQMPHCGLTHGMFRLGWETPMRGAPYYSSILKVRDTRSSPDLAVSGTVSR